MGAYGMRAPLMNCPLNQAKGGRRRILDFWRDDDTVYVIGLPIEFKRDADVKSKVWCRRLQDFVGRHGYPRAIDLHLIMITDLSS